MSTTFLRTYIKPDELDRVAKRIKKGHPLTIKTSSAKLPFSKAMFIGAVFCYLFSFIQMFMIGPAVFFALVFVCIAVTHSLYFGISTSYLQSHRSKIMFLSHSFLFSRKVRIRRDEIGAIVIETHKTKLAHGWYVKLYFKLKNRTSIHVNPGILKVEDYGESNYLRIKLSKLLLVPIDLIKTKDYEWRTHGY